MVWILAAFTVCVGAIDEQSCTEVRMRADAPSVLLYPSEAKCEYGAEVRGIIATAQEHAEVAVEVDAVCLEVAEFDPPPQENDGTPEQAEIGEMSIGISPGCASAERHHGVKRGWKRHAPGPAFEQSTQRLGSMHKQYRNDAQGTGPSTYLHGQDGAKSGRAHSGHRCSEAAPSE